MIKAYPRQGKLAGALKQYDITYQELADNISTTVAHLSNICNGKADFKLSLARKIRDYISKKAGIELQISDIIE
jgi:predicted transcriptional regulator